MRAFSSCSLYRNTFPKPLQLLNAPASNPSPQSLAKMNDKISDAGKKMKVVEGLLGPWLGHEGAWESWENLSVEDVELKNNACTWTQAFIIISLVRFWILFGVSEGLKR